MKKSCQLMAVVALLGICGCGDGQQAATHKAIQVAKESFDTAPEALKADYAEIKSALASNDLVKAKASLDQLLAAQLSPEQQQAVAEQRQALMVKASVAAQQGDANAAKIIQELRSRSRGR